MATTRLSNEHILAAKQAVDEECARASDPFATCLDEAACASSASTVEQAIQAFMFALKALELDATLGRLKRKQRAELVELAESMLIVMGVKPVSSRLSFLWKELHDVLALEREAQGDRFAAACQRHLGNFLKRSTGEKPSTADRLSYGEYLLRSGQGDFAGQVFETECANAVEHADFALASFHAARCARLQGDMRRARERFSILRNVSDLSPEILHEIEWESFCLAIADGDHAPMAAAVRPRVGSHWSASYVLEANLWGYAIRSPEMLRRIPGTQSASIGKNGEPMDRAQKALLDAVRLLESLNDEVRILKSRLEMVETAERIAQALARVDHEMLLWIGVSRFLLRKCQYSWAAMTLGKYRVLSLGLSSGRTYDVLGIAGDVGDLGQSATPSLDEVVEPPTGWLARAFGMTELAAIAATGSLKAKTAGLFRDKVTQIRMQEQAFELTAIKMAQYMAHFRGPMMKLGQFLSILGPGMPDPVQRSFAALRTLPTHGTQKDAARVIESELKAPLKEIFQSFDETPLAVASMAQVHRAVLKDGTEVVVKVLYPDVEKTVKHDLSVLKMLMPLFKVAVPSVDHKAVFQELLKVFHDECDLRVEARHQVAIAKNLADVVGLTIPKVYPEASSRRILTMDLARGLHLEDFLTIADQDARKRALRTLIEAMVKSIVRDGHFHADPHPGNFLFQPDGHVVMFDFGCARQLEQEAHAGIIEYVTSLLNGDLDRIVEFFLHKLNMKGKDLEMASKTLREIMRMEFDTALSPIVRGGKMLLTPELGRDLIEGLMQLGRDPVMGKWVKKCLVADPAHTFASRAIATLVHLVLKLQVEVDVREEVLRALDGVIEIPELHLHAAS